MNIRVKFLLVLGLSLLSVIELHAEPLKIESVEFKAKKANLDFGEPIILPFVSSKQPKIAKKINDYLYINILSTPAPVNAKDGIVRKITEADDDPIVGVTSMRYKLLLNDGKVFSVQFNSELCGAYCEDNASSYGFDASTGRHLTLQDIFTANGIDALKKKVYAARVMTMKQEIKRLKKEIAKPNKKKQQKDEFEADPQHVIFLYETCLTETATSHDDEIKSGDHHELDYFTIEAKGIAFSHERCSNHAERALDSIDQFNNHYNFQQLKPYFTAYAKHLLLRDTAKFEQPSDIMGQVFYGNIGQSKITFLIKQAEGYDRMLRAMYFYDKYRQPIELTGTGNTWTEINSASKPQPTIKATLQADTLSGQWLGGGKTLPFKIAP